MVSETILICRHTENQVFPPSPPDLVLLLLPRGSGRGRRLRSRCLYMLACGMGSERAKLEREVSHCIAPLSGCTVAT